MDYRIEVFDAAGRRIAAYDDVPLLEATRALPDRPDCILGMLPGRVPALGHGCRVRVCVEGQTFCEGRVTRLAPQWGDARKLILDRYVGFHEVIAFEAESEPDEANTTVTRACTGREAGALVKDLINHASGPVHYRVRHGAYPEGARREHEKFLARKTPGNELETGGIATGQWVGANRIDASAAYAKDGDTIAGLVVDGVPWPDLRLMMIDSEELSRNSHAAGRHPEVADWTDERYNASGYRLRAEAARDALQALIDTRGIGYVELNPHRDAAGAFDDRIDAYGRYLGLVFGGDECFNAAMVEQGLADVYLYSEGRYLDPALQLKDFYSYAGPAEESVETTDASLWAWDFSGGVLEAVAALAYAAGGYVWSVEPDLAVSFRRVERPDHVVFYRARDMSVGFGSDSAGLGNIIGFEGSPFLGALEKTYSRGESIDAYGHRYRHFGFFSISREEDADRLVAGLLDDVAYPQPAGFITFFSGDAAIRTGDVVEIRDGPVRRLDPALPNEWGGRFTGRLVGRAGRVTHRFSGRHVSTTVELTSPLRSVENPLSYIVRSQPGPASLYQFRLDDAIVGADLGFHLD